MKKPPVGHSSRRLVHKGLRADDFVAFFQHMTTLLASGVPLLESLMLVSRQTESKTLAAALVGAARDISAGLTLHGSMALHPSVFKASWVSVVRVGEKSGQLPQVLAQLSRSLAESKATSDRVRSAFIYPIFLFLVSFASLIVMLFVVIPSFAEFFSDFNATLPWLTRTVLGASQLAKKWWPLGIGFPAVLTVCFRSGLVPALRWEMAIPWLRKVPVIGVLNDGLSMETFAQNLSLFLRSGTPLYEALQLIQTGALTAGPFSASLTEIRKEIAHGYSFANSLEKARWFSPLLVSMARVGEESGKLPEVMDSIAHHYREQNRATVHRLTKILEPVIIVSMGALIGAMLAAVYLPMFELASLPGSH